MKNPLSHYIMLAKRWAWIVLLGIVICGSVTYVVSKLTHPVYQASALLMLNLGSSQTSPYENTNASLAAVSTYAQVLQNHTVLNPVLAKHKDLTLKQLTTMMTVKPQLNTQNIELDIQDTNPKRAAQLANEISQSFAQYANAQSLAYVLILPAEPPVDPIKPKPLQDSLIGALVGLGLALALIVIFEWVDDRPANLEEVERILGLEVLTTIPQLSRQQREKNAEQIPALAEGCRVLCASLNAMQSIKPFKLMMVTSALAGEGKSTIAANLASFLATSGKRVLLVDANLRNPALDQHFQLDNRQGLAGVFLAMWAQLNVNLDGQETEIPTLRVLTAGTLPGNSADLLQSPLAKQLFEHFKKLDFDYVIFDTPPLLPVADAQILASFVQATVLVVDASKTPRKVLLRAKNILGRTRTMVLGVAINKNRSSEPGDISQYLNDARQPKTGTSVIMSPLPPHTPPVDGLAKQDITVTLGRSQKNSQGKP